MPDIASTMTLLRNTLAEHQADLELWDPSIPDGADQDAIPQEAPAGVGELLRASDGLYLDHSTRLFEASEIMDRQFPEGLEDAELPNGSPLDDTSRFFFFGLARENPLLVDRDGSVWRAPDEGALWYTGCRLEQIAGSVDEFFRTWVASSRFQDLAGLTPDDLDNSHWYQLLRLSGLAT
ncbi:hypothetical protein [Streptomyces sp. FH025]|uniref:hypothetical protein n=1 Tax=Streptomyces sp. FH025 TaxID=2815937 RepID=UPI001A9D11BA|nr:hypothetical protein [Streptomyces sp. FH025]MBO1415103.1 hypothetical protein [Streptomyces sp. FH025]